MAEQAGPIPNSGLELWLHVPRDPPRTREGHQSLLRINWQVCMGIARQTHRQLAAVSNELVEGENAVLANL